MDKIIKEEKRYEVFVCRHCGNKASHLLIYRHKVPVPLGLFGPNFEEINAEDYYFLFECGTCSGISLKNIYSEEIDSDPRIETPFENIHYLFPSSKSTDGIPKGLESITAEANRVKHVSNLAYLILVRKVLEEVCKDRKANGKNLKEKLDSLVKNEELPSIFSKASEKSVLSMEIIANDLTPFFSRSSFPPCFLSTTTTLHSIFPPKLLIAGSHALS